MKRFNQNIIFGLILILIALILLLWAAMYSLRIVVSRQNELISTDVNELLLASELRSQIGRQLGEMPVYVMTGNKTLLNSLQDDKHNFFEIIIQLKSLITNRSEKLMLDRIKGSQIKQNIYGDIGINMKRNGVSTLLVNDYFSKFPAAQADTTLNQLNNFVKYLTQIYNKERDANIIHSKNIVTYFTIVSGFAILICLITTILITRIILQKSVAEQANELLTKKEKQLSEARKDVIEVVAHDLKSPLTSINLSVQFMQQGLRTNTIEQSAKFLNIINFSIQSMERLINDLLDHTKIESQNLVLSKEICAADAILKFIVLRFEAIAREKNVTIEVLDYTSDSKLYMDVGRIEQVFSNLLSNAIKFTKAGGTVRCSTSDLGTSILYSIADTGPGLTKNQQDHIFERYWQVRETSSGGTGLGLAISKGIIDAHQGNIWVESATGKGSDFFVSLPK